MSIEARLKIKGSLIEDLEFERKQLKLAKRQIKIKDEYLKLILFTAVGYDGMTTKKGLKSLIDQLVDYAYLALNNDDKTVIYGGKIKGENGKELNLGTPTNILLEEIKEE